MATEPSLRQRTGRAVAWSVVESWGSKAASMVVFIVLARLLAPSDFGVVAAANVVIQLILVLVVAGFAEAIVQREVLTPGHLQAAFFTSTALGAVLAVATIASAGLIGSLLDTPEVVPVVRVMSAVFIIQGAASAPRALLRRELRFASIAARSVLGSAIGGSAGIVAAVFGAGEWALVVHALVEASIGMTVVMAAARFVPTGRFTGNELRSLLGFSTASLAADLINFFHLRSDDLIVAWRLGQTALGFYSVGYRFMRLFDDMVSMVLYNVSFPVFSKIQFDRSRLRDAYLEACRLASVFIVPVFTGLSLCSAEIVLVVFGDKWVPAGPVMRALCLAGLARGIQLFSLSALKARGAMRVVLGHRLVATGMFVAGFIIASAHGIVAVAVTYATLVTVTSIVPPIFVARELRFSLSGFLAAVAPAFVAGAAMVPAVLVVQVVSQDWSALARLVASGAGGALVYCAVLWRLMPGIVPMVREQLRSALSSRTAGRDLSDAAS